MVVVEQSRGGGSGGRIGGAVDECGGRGGGVTHGTMDERSMGAAGRGSDRGAARMEEWGPAAQAGAANVGTAGVTDVCVEGVQRRAI